VASVVPTDAEKATALASAYSGSNKPRTGDTVLLTVSSVLKFRAKVTLSNTGSGPHFITFTVSGANYYAALTQTGIY
jgi:hypothetical protein